MTEIKNARLKTTKHTWDAQLKHRLTYASWDTTCSHNFNAALVGRDIFQ